MGVTSQILDDTGITIDCADGSTYSLSPAQLLSIYSSNSDNINATANAILNQINSALGSNLDSTGVTIVFDPNTGQINDFETGVAGSGSITVQPAG